MLIIKLSRWPAGIEDAASAELLISSPGLLLMGFHASNRYILSITQALEITSYLGLQSTYLWR